MSKFEAGKTYTTRLITDADSAVGITVAKRTEKTITTQAGKVLRVKVCPYTQAEKVFPLGRYSMCPVISA